MADTEEERMKKYPPPPTGPHQRSKLSLGPDALPSAHGHPNDETITSSACADALKDFVDPTQDNKVKDEEGSETEEEDASDV